MSGPGLVQSGGPSLPIAADPRASRGALLEDLRDRDEQPGLLVDGELWLGWDTITWERSIDDLVGVVSFSGRARRPWGVNVDQALQLRVGKDEVLTGRVDALQVSAGSQGAAVSGHARDLASVLLDSSALNSPPEWFGIDVLELARALASPFGLQVAADVDVGPPLAEHRLEVGETPWACLERALRLRGILGVSDGRGGVLLTRPGTKRAEERLDWTSAVTRDRAVKEASLTISSADRYRRILVRGQAPGWEALGTDGDEDAGDLADVYGVEGEAFDPGARADRTLILSAPKAVDDDEARAMAQWEATVRAARSHTVHVVVSGWRQRKGGPLWEPGLLVPVRIPPLEIDSELVIRSVRCSFDGTGTQTQLSLARPGAYEPEQKLDPAADVGRPWLIKVDGELVVPPKEGD